MYDKAKVTELVKQLTEKLYGIQPAILNSSMYGQSSITQLQQDLRRMAGELMHGLNSNWERQAVAEQLSKIEGQVQNAAAMGLLGDKDLQTYLGMIDEIYTELDQEN